MFSAFKKLTNKNEVQNGSGHNGLVGLGKPGEGVHSMSHNLQKKFAKVGKDLNQFQWLKC